MTIERPYRLSDFEFNLPDELIAQEPANERDASRLLVMSRGGGLEHRMFRDILEYLREGDVLVVYRLDLRGGAHRLDRLELKPAGERIGVAFERREHDRPPERFVATLERSAR